MGRYSLIAVESEKDDTVSGFWMQDYTGSFEGACIYAGNLEKINQATDVAVVPAVTTTTPLLQGLMENLKRLDKKRSHGKRD